MTETSANTCPRCGAKFACGMHTGAEPCWCAQLPVLQVSREQASDCYCPACLKQLLDAQRAAAAAS